MTKKILVLGSTGSIGTQTLDVVREFKDSFSICGLSTFSRLPLLKRQIEEFHPTAVNVTNPKKEIEARELAASCGIRLTEGNQGLSELVELCRPDIVVVATVGIAGLKPTLQAIGQGADVALANKEVLVTGGDLVMKAARDGGVRILPIDSEHNAIAQCLMGQDPGSIQRIILTASGGPFRNLSREELARVTPDQALNHPTWSMGPKITIDSATLMNKGFEVIEAYHLFGISPNHIKVVIHPQSVIHSLVEFVDGSLLAQLSITDMHLTIQSALFFPERRPNKFAPLEISALDDLSFSKPDTERFPCLRYAYDSLDMGGTAPVVLNAANEVAVRRFLKGEISFPEIAKIIGTILEKHDIIPLPDLETIMETDRQARRIAEEL